MINTWKSITWLQFGAAMIFAMTKETAQRLCHYPWIEGEISFLELHLYNMRHVQDHAAHLNMFLGQHGVALNTWVPRAGSAEA